MKESIEQQISKLEQEIIELRFQNAILKMKIDSPKHEEFNDYIHALPLTQHAKKDKEVSSTQEQRTRFDRPARKRNKRAKGFKSISSKKT